MALSQKFVRQLFPPVEFAFFGNYVNRYKRKITKKQLPSIDLIMAVEDPIQFHKDNLKQNKTHYTYFVRSTHGRIVHKIQDMGARMHFNIIRLDGNDEIKVMNDGQESAVSIRYGIIGIEDMLRDLHHWETLLCSSFMQRPHEILEKGSRFDEVLEKQQYNLKSALAYAALTTPNNSNIKDLYKTIVEIPHYQQKRLSYFLDKEDEETVVDDSFDGFQAMYEPLIKDKFRDVMEVRDGKLLIDNDDKATQRFLYSEVNDNIFKNLEGFSVRLFDQEQRFNKEQFTQGQQSLIIEKLIENDRKQQEEMIFDATDRILIAHRNLKMFLLCTSGPFFAILFLIKYTIKFSVLYFLYNKKKKEAAAQDKENSQVVTPLVQVPNRQ